MKILSRDDILEADDLKSEQVEVPEWGGAVMVRTMNGADRDAFEVAMIAVDADGKRKADMLNMRTKLVALTVVDEAGNHVFSMDDIERLSLKSAIALNRVFQAAQRINGIGSEAEAEAVKNLPAGLSEGSTSA